MAKAAHAPTQARVRDTMLGLLDEAGRPMAVSTLTVKTRAAFPGAPEADVDKQVFHWLQEAANGRGPFRLTDNLLVARRN